MYRLIAFSKMLQFSNSSSVMEAETISKNGASSKSQTSRGNIFRMLCFALVGIAICGNVLAQSEWTYKNGRVRQDGRIIGEAQVRESLSGNSEALQQYKSGRVLYNVGGIIMLPGAFAIGGGLGYLVGAHAAGLVDDSNRSGVYTASGILIGVGLAIGATGYIISNSGAKKVKNVIDMHNSTLRRDVSWQVNFGITPSGGVGLTMLF